MAPNRKTTAGRGKTASKKGIRPAKKSARKARKGDTMRKGKSKTKNKSKVGIPEKKKQGQSSKQQQKGFPFFKLPVELRLCIYESAIDSQSYVTYATALHVQVNNQRQVIRLGNQRLSDQSSWRWALGLVEAIPESRSVVRDRFSTREGHLRDPLTSIRGDTDLMVYLFPELAHYSWAREMDKAYNRQNMSRGVQNVGIRWNPTYTLGFRCICSSVELYRHNNQGGVCYREVVDFLDHCPDVCNLFIQVILRTKNARVGRTAESVQNTVKRLIGRAEKDASLAVFKDCDRTWAEILRSDRHLLTSETQVVFDVAAKIEKRFNRRYILGPTPKIRCRVLLSSWTKMK